MIINIHMVAKLPSLSPFLDNLAAPHNQNMMVCVCDMLTRCLIYIMHGLILGI